MISRMQMHGSECAYAPFPYQTQINFKARLDTKCGNTGVCVTFHCNGKTQSIEKIYDLTLFYFRVSINCIYGATTAMPQKRKA